MFKWRQNGRESIGVATNAVARTYPMFPRGYGFSVVVNGGKVIQGTAIGPQSVKKAAEKVVK